MPLVYGHQALIKATRSSAYLATSPEVRNANGAYFNAKAIATPSPDAVLDERTRNTIWEACETHRDRLSAS